jgi:hypothetical protein
MTRPGWCVAALLLSLDRVDNIGLRGGERLPGSVERIGQRKRLAIFLRL